MLSMEENAVSKKYLGKDKYNKMNNEITTVKKQKFSLALCILFFFFDRQ